MKVGLIIASMRTGGAERAFLNLANGFSTQGIQTDLVLVEKTGELISKLSSKVVIHDLHKKKARQSIFSFRNYLNNNSPDVIIVAQFHVQIIVLIAAGLSSWKGKIILNEQSTFSRNVTGSFNKTLARVFFRRTDAVSAVSRQSLDDLKSVFPFLKARSQVIPNPVITDDIFTLKTEDVSHPFLNNKSKPVILGAGRLSTEKNFKLLIDAFLIVRKKIDAQLIILGEGKERGLLEKYISECNAAEYVSLPGNVSNPYAFMSKADVFVLSSNYEGLPAVLIEALACNCKVVSTDCPSGPSEILEDGKYGKLVPPGDPELMANAIIETISENNNESISQHDFEKYSSEAIISNYLRLIKSISE